MRVVDHRALRRAAHIAQRFGEKRLAIEALKLRPDLEVEQARVAQHRRGGLRFVLASADDDFVRRCVMLHLDAWLEVIATGGHDWLLTDALPAAERGQRLIRQCRAVGPQLFMDSHEIAFARLQQLEDPLAMRRCLLFAFDLRHCGGVRFEHLAHALAREVQQFRDLAFVHALRS